MNAQCQSPQVFQKLVSKLELAKNFNAELELRLQNTYSHFENVEAQYVQQIKFLERKLQESQDFIMANSMRLVSSAINLPNLPENIGSKIDAAQLALSEISQFESNSSLAKDKIKHILIAFDHFNQGGQSESNMKLIDQILSDSHSLIGQVALEIGNQRQTTITEQKMPTERKISLGQAFSSIKMIKNETKNYILLLKSL
jgi:hypothetical protein